MPVPFCGPKLSACCAVLSLWGIIMLASYNLFYSIAIVVWNIGVSLKADRTVWNTDSAIMLYAVIVEEIYDKQTSNLGEI